MNCVDVCNSPTRIYVPPLNNNTLGANMLGIGGLVSLLFCAAIAWGNDMKGWAIGLGLIALASGYIGVFGLPEMVN
ncbi:MAG: hypothetical protein AB8H79_00055 [Myxococcota bacterium]